MSLARVVVLTALERPNANVNELLKSMIQFYINDVLRGMLSFFSNYILFNTTRYSWNIEASRKVSGTIRIIPTAIYFRHLPITG